MPVANVVLPTLQVISIRLGDASKRSVDHVSMGLGALERLFDVRARVPASLSVQSPVKWLLPQ